MDLKGHIPLHHQLRVYLEERIRDGRYKEGERLPAEPELMEQFGVSRGTVRKAYDVLVATGLVERRSGKGSFVKIQQTDGQNLTIGVVVANPEIFSIESNPTNWQLCLDKLNGVIAMAARKGVEVELIQHSPDIFKENLCDGYLILDVCEHIKVNVEKQPVGNIVIVSEMPFESKHCVVRCEIERCFQEATDFLVSQPFERIGFIGSRDELRLGNFKKSLVRNKKTYYPELLEDANIGTVEDGEHAAKMLFERVDLSSVEAIFCTTDLRARGVLAYCRKHGIRVPEDISVMGFDNLSFGAYEKPKLTTYETPRVQLGKKGLALLLDMLKKPSANYKNVKLTGKVVIRDSVKIQ